MTKEEILAELKVLVLTLRDEQEKLKTDPVFASSWLSKQHEIGIDVKKLNSCDADWLNDQYGAWFNEKIKSNLPEIDPSVKDKLLWQ